MDLKSDLIQVASTHCKATGMSKARLATIVANDGKFFTRIEGGGGLTTAMYERFMQYFEEHPAPPRSRRKAVA